MPVSHWLDSSYQKLESVTIMQSCIFCIYGDGGLFNKNMYKRSSKIYDLPEPEIFDTNN
jgi:hypothetical protein